MFNIGDNVRFQELCLTGDSSRGDWWKLNHGVILSVKSEKALGVVFKDFYVRDTEGKFKWIEESKLELAICVLDKSEFDTTIYENLPPPMGQEDMGR